MLRLKSSVGERLQQKSKALWSSLIGPCERPSNFPSVESRIRVLALKNSGFGLELSELGFGEFVNVKLINVAPPDSPPWGPVHLN